MTGELELYICVDESEPKTFIFNHRGFVSVSQTSNKPRKKFVMSRKEYEAYCMRFYQSVKEDLDKFRIARLRSEEAGRRHVVY